MEMREFAWVMTVQAVGPAGVQLREQAGVATAPAGARVTRDQLFKQIRGEVTDGLSGAWVLFWSIEPNEL